MVNVKRKFSFKEIWFTDRNIYFEYVKWNKWQQKVEIIYIYVWKVYRQKRKKAYNHRTAQSKINIPTLDNFVYMFENEQEEVNNPI